MIQVAAGQTVYQALNKIFIRKNVPWFKCGKILIFSVENKHYFKIILHLHKDLYYVGDYQVILLIC